MAAQGSRTSITWIVLGEAHGLLQNAWHLCDAFLPTWSAHHQRCGKTCVSSVVADALGEHTFEFIAELLSERAGVPVVERMLRQQECMNKTYWICAFAVNQHRGICGSNPRADVDPVTHIPHPVCHCTAPKIFNTTLPVNSDGQSIECEMNKFDDMSLSIKTQNIPLFEAEVT